MQKKRAVLNEIQNLSPQNIIGDEPAIYNNIESILVR